MGGRAGVWSGVGSGSGTDGGVEQEASGMEATWHKAPSCVIVLELGARGEDKASAGRLAEHRPGVEGRRGGPGQGVEGLVGPGSVPACPSAACFPGRERHVGAPKLGCLY